MEKELPNSSEFLSLTPDERSILMLEWLKTIITNQTNHLRHHWAITLVCAASAFNLGVAFLIIFFKVE